MSAPWPSESESSLNIERNRQGRIIFRGPRVCIFVHSCSSIQRAMVTDERQTRSTEGRLQQFEHSSLFMRSNSLDLSKHRSDEQPQPKLPKHRSDEQHQPQHTIDIDEPDFGDKFGDPCRVSFDVAQLSDKPTAKAVRRVSYAVDQLSDKPTAKKHTIDIEGLDLGDILFGEQRARRLSNDADQLGDKPIKKHALNMDELDLGDILFGDQRVRRVSLDVDQFGEKKVKNLSADFARRKEALYNGPGFDLGVALCDLVYPGQLVLSEPVWIQVQDHLPNLTQVCEAPFFLQLDIYDTKVEM